MQDRLAMVGVPALAGIVTALVLLGPAQERPARGARARGVVTRASRSWALRVETLQYLGGLYSADGSQHIELTLMLGEHAISSWRGHTDAGGLVEARLQLEPEHIGQDRYELRLGRAGRLLSRTVIQPSRPLAPVQPTARYLRKGEPAIELIIPRGVLAPPFPEPAELRIHTTAPPRPADDEAQDDQPADKPANAPSSDAGQPQQNKKDTPQIDSQARDQADSERDRKAPPARINVTAQGARIERGKLTHKGCRAGICSHHLPLTITAEAPAVELDIAVERADRKNQWSGALNVHNGAIWLDPEPLKESRIELRSAVPKDQVFVSLLGTEGRSWGALVPMQTKDGFAQGALKLPEPITAPATLIVAGDAYEPAISATWPASPSYPMVEPKTLSLLADGMPAAQKREEARRARARRPAWGIVLAAGLFELFYLWRRFRLSQIKLARHLREQGGLDPTELDALAQPRALTWLVALSVALMLMFIVLAGVAAFG